MNAFLSPQAECDIRDFGKKVHNLEIEFDETNDKLNKVGRTCVYSLMSRVLTSTSLFKLFLEGLFLCETSH
jgi:hypothetical protein